MAAGDASGQCRTGQTVRVTSHQGKGLLSGLQGIPELLQDSNKATHSGGLTVTATCGDRGVRGVLPSKDSESKLPARSIRAELLRFASP